MLQDTPAERGALRVSRASHTTSCRGDMDAFFEGVECGGGDPNDTPNGDPNGNGAAAANESSVGLPIAMPAGSVLLMDSRSLHGGGAHTMDSRSLHGGGAHTMHHSDTALPASSGITHHTALLEAGGADRDGGGDRRHAAARVVFYFSYASPRTSSAPYLPIGSTYALRGELWGRMAVPLRPMGMVHHAMHTPAAYASSRSSGAPVSGDMTSATSGATSAADATHTHPGATPGATPDQWSIVDLVTVRLEMCLQGGEWHANLALLCLANYGVANAATLFVRHRAHERATLGLGHGAHSMI